MKYLYPPENIGITFAVSVQSYTLGRRHQCRSGGHVVMYIRDIIVYLSNRPQVFMVYRLINHAGCW